MQWKHYQVQAFKIAKQFMERASQGKPALNATKAEVPIPQQAPQSGQTTGTDNPAAHSQTSQRQMKGDVKVEMNEPQQTESPHIRPQLTGENLRKQAQAAAVARQRSLQAQRKPDAAVPQTQPPAVAQGEGANANAVAVADGTPLWAPPSSLTAENLKFPAHKRRKVSPVSAASGDAPSASAPISELPKDLAAPGKISPVQNQAQVSEISKTVEIHRCTYTKCDHAVRGFPTKDMLSAHLDEHRNREKQMSNPLGYCLDSLQIALGLNQDHKQMGTFGSSESKDIPNEAGSSEVMKLDKVSPLRHQLAPSTRPIHKAGVVGFDIIPGLDKEGHMDQSEQLPTPPPQIMARDGSLSPTIIRQCFAGLEQFSGLAASCYETVHIELGLTPAQTPDETTDEGNGGDVSSDPNHLLEDWNPFNIAEDRGGKGFSSADLIQGDFDWEREARRNIGFEGQVKSSWTSELFEVRG